MDFLSALRLGNIFDPGQMSMGGATFMPTPDPSLPDNSLPPVQGGDVNPDIAAQMAQLYTPQTGASDKLAALMGQYPQYNQPGTGRQFLAATGKAMAQLGGPMFAGGANDVSNRILGIPQHEQAVQDWKNQIVPAESEANLEKAANVNERTAAYQTVTEGLKARAENEKEKSDQDKANAAEQRIQLQNLKLTNPNLSFNFHGPTVMIADPKTGQIKDTGIPTGNLSEMDKINLGQSNEMARIDERGQQAQTLAQSTKGWSLGMIPDPNNPGKQIAVRINQDNGDVQPVTLGGKSVSDIQKPGSEKTGVNGQPSPAQMKYIQDGSREAIGIIDQLMDTQGNLTDLTKARVGTNPVSSLVGKVEGFAGATQSAKAEAVINTLKAKLTLDLFQEMKDASKNGATGFGRMTNMEFNTLQNSIGQLDPSLDQDTFKSELARIREKLQKVLLPPDGTTPSVSTKPGSQPTADDLIKKYSGSGGGSQ